MLYITPDLNISDVPDGVWRIQRLNAMALHKLLLDETAKQLERGQITPQCGDQFLFAKEVFDSEDLPSPAWILATYMQGSLPT